MGNTILKYISIFTASFIMGYLLVLSGLTGYNYVADKMDTIEMLLENQHTMNDNLEITQEGVNLCAETVLILLQLEMEKESIHTTF